MARIETTSPYVGSYDDIVDKGHQEVDGGFLPEIRSLDLNIDAHATVILGSPVWWYSLAPAMRTFLHEHDLMEVCFGKNRLGNLGPEPSRLGRVMPSRSH